MTAAWSLPVLLAEFHQEIQQELVRARKLAHPTDKGDASEAVWLSVLSRYLPRRYEARKGHVVDSQGKFSDQIDLIIHDRQYSPFVFRFKDTDIVPAESVYAVFEAKQDIAAEHIAYAQRKILTVRQLHRTSLPVQTIDGLKEPKPQHHIIGGILTLGSTWTPPMGDALLSHLQQDIDGGRLDIGCIADAGWFTFRGGAGYSIMPVDKAATRFLFELVAQLQTIGTVPMLDPRAYSAQI